MRLGPQPFTAPTPPGGSPSPQALGPAEVVGFQVRFSRQTSKQTRLKIMTDGVLLAEIGRDRVLPPPTK